MTLTPYLQILNSQIQLIAEVLEPDQYTSPISLLSDASIGKHNRHIIEAFQAVVDGINEDHVCFDKRKRDLSLETDPNAAVHRMAELSKTLLDCNLNKNITLKNDFSYEGDPQPNMTPSCLERELIYAIEHAIHHLAIIKIGIVHSFGVDLPDDFGVAPSTLRYMKKAS